VNAEIETPDASTDKKLNLQVDIQPKGACERHVTVVVPRSDIDLYFSRKFDELAPKAELPGFRPGKAPRKLLEKKFRKQIADQVKAELLMDSLTQVQDSSDFSAISEPDLDFQSVILPETGDLKYEFNIEVRPDFELPVWSGLSLERPEHEFTEAEVNAEIRLIAKQLTDIEPVDSPAEAGDMLVCNIVCRHEGRTIETNEEVGIDLLPKVSFADATIEGFDQLMLGAVAGEKRETSVQINEFCENTAVSGKTVEIEVEVLDVKRAGGINDEEIATRLDFASAEEMRTFINDRLFRKLQYEQRMAIRRQITEQLTKGANWELPPDLLRRQARRELERSIMEMRSSGLEEMDIDRLVVKMRGNIVAQTEKSLKEHFILEKIAEDQNIQDTPEDYEMEIMRIAVQQQDSPRRVRAMIERANQMDALRNMIIERKVIELITEKATFKAMPYVTQEDKNVAIVNCYLSGEPSAIPEAKFDGGDQPPIPGTQSKS
jgi:trigger factor